MNSRFGKCRSWARTMLATAAISALAIPDAASAQAQTPQWNSIARLDDGRTFVTDGIIVLDATLAEPANLPTETVPTAWLQAFLSTAQPDEFRFRDLTLEPRGGTNVYLTKSGMLLNPVYLDYLRQVFGDQLRLRSAGALDPVQIVVGGVAVGAVMPMKP